MKILAKSAIKKIDIYGKTKICKDIELQIFNEFNKFNDCVQSLYDLIISTDADIHVVHSPLISGEDINIEFIENPEDNFRLSKTIELAGKLSDYYNHNIKIVFHTAFRFENYEKFPSILEKMEEFIENYLKEYNKIIFCIENVIPCKVTKDKKTYMRNGCLYDNVKLVKYLRNKLETDRIQTVLDTCHAMVSIEFLENAFSKNYKELFEEFNINLEQFFIENKDIIGLIHLCDVKNLGYKPKEHGIKFKYDRLFVFNYIMSMYEKYDYDCDITIEILRRLY